MKRDDLVLLHPPSVYDFRERPIFYGPIADVIPSSPVFEMYPVGFLTLVAYLRRHARRARIVNLALLMMRDQAFDVERCLSRLRPRLFGIDLHWLPHVHGSLDVARCAKRVHPETPTVFGGISSTYFHDELIRYPQVDFVLRGSICEASLLALLRQLEGQRDFAAVPGLTWKQNGAVRINPPAREPPALDELSFDLGLMVRQVVTRMDFWSTAPFHAWWRHPITAVFTVRGCDRGCVTCGASAAAFDRFMPGPHPLRRSPEMIATQVRQLALISRAPIFLVGDLLTGGEEYAHAVVDALSRTPVGNRLTFEFFSPPPASFIDHIDRSVRRWGAEISPESHDPAIRAALGKAEFDNGAMERAIADLLARRCDQLDVFLMLGLPRQTPTSVMDSIAWVESLFERFDQRLSAFITPMGPFLDPGSDAFERAEELGYRRFARTLEEHRQLLEARDWEGMLSYETRWMTRAEIVEATFDAAQRLNAAKVRTGRLAPERGAGVEARLAAARRLRERLRQANRVSPDASTETAVRTEGGVFSEAVLNDKRELFPPAAFLRQFRLYGILRVLLADLLAHPWS